MEYQEAANLILQAKNMYALTGAGISTESGIPDFRSDRGYYKEFDGATAFSRDVLLGDPDRFYHEGFVMLKDLFAKKPNAGHKALKKMEDLGYLKGIITQNIDNLHSLAGSKKVYEVHGHTRTVHCMSCNKTYPFQDYVDLVTVEGEIPPRCPACQGVLRPDVVMFGDMMPQDFQDAYGAMETCDLLLVAGSSLVVAPVSYLPGMAKKLIIINKEATPYDHKADVVIHEGIGQALTKILSLVEEGAGQ